MGTEVPPKPTVLWLSWLWMVLSSSVPQAYFGALSPKHTESTSEHTVTLKDGAQGSTHAHICLGQAAKGIAQCPS